MNATDLFPKSASATPEDAMDAAMQRIREAWNESIPRRKFHKWTPARITAARATLRIWTLSEVIGAIRCYGRAPWQTNNRAWQRIDTWIKPSEATKWCEHSIQEFDDADWKRKADDARVAETADALAETMRVKGEEESLLAVFAAMDPAAQAVIFAQANDEIVALGGRRRPPKQANMKNYMIRKHTLMILRRGAAT